MNGYEFEKAVADLFEQRGWETTVTNKSQDRGIDIIAERTDPFIEKMVIQAKKYALDNKIGSPDVQQYNSLRSQVDGTDKVIIVTTSSFTKQAKSVANDLNVKLIEGTTLCEMFAEQGMIAEQRVGDSYQEEYQNTKKTLLCPFCGERVERSSASYINHMSDGNCRVQDTDKIQPRRPNGIPSSICDDVKREFGIEDRNKNDVKKNGKEQGENNTSTNKLETFSCPFCDTDIIHSSSAVISHLCSDECSTYSSDDLPAERPEGIPPSIWWDIKDEFRLW
ncbi:restriction endonuclease [Salinigranum salinum]|uniref:restriction endonuclease n=1 Tax=Salinigranum salinum TaxID=1364937 RepID=UPI001864F7BD|nr:restriction endonuclease [Salinigranum salinum]